MLPDWTQLAQAVDEAPASDPGFEQELQGAEAYFHFAMAKLTGVKVNTFSIGFGKTLAGFRRGGTDYCIKAIPLGGFVAMAGEQPDDEHTGNSDEFSSKPVPIRMSIAVAGPIVNIAFAFTVLVILYMIGVMEPVQNDVAVGRVLEDSPAQKAGMLNGDRIIALNGKPVSGMEKFFQDIVTETDNTLIITVRRDLDTLDLPVTPEMHKSGIATIGIQFGDPAIYLHRIHPGSPSEKAGFKEGDKLLSAEGKEIPDSETFIGIVDSSQGNEILVEVLRNHEKLVIPVSPEMNDQLGRHLIGADIGYKSPPEKLVKRNFKESIIISWRDNISNSQLIFRILSRLFQGKVKPKALSGPIGILQGIGFTFRLGPEKFTKFLALISLNLGIINLLPLFITDGGIIFFLLIESVRRKPLDTRIQMKINQVAISLLIALALFITFHDILRFPMWFK